MESLLTSVQLNHMNNSAADETECFERGLLTIPRSMMSLERDHLSIAKYFAALSHQWRVTATGGKLRVLGGG